MLEFDASRQRFKEMLDMIDRQAGQREIGKAAVPFGIDIAP